MTPTLTTSPLAYRGDGTGRPASVTLPPAAAPAWKDGRLRKHWRYAGIWSATVSVCAAQVAVGPLTQEFWAIWLPGTGELHHRTRLRPGRVHFGADRLRVADGDVDIDVLLPSEPASAFEVITPVDRAWTWTRKTATRARGHVRIGSRHLEVDAPALVEDNGGYHPRHTHWWWAAGAGTLTDGRPAMWNAVVGLNDTLPHIENTVWVDGTPQPTGLVQISPDLTTTRFDDGTALTFTVGVDRTAITNLLAVRSQYRAPFGRFTGTLPGGLTLAEGHGVMEDHHARW